MSQEQIIAAESKLDEVKATVERVPVATELTPEEEAIYETIPDEFKVLAERLLSIRGVLNPNYDIRSVLVKKGMIELWKWRNEINSAYELGYNARKV